MRHLTKAVRLAGMAIAVMVVAASSQITAAAAADSTAATTEARLKQLEDYQSIQQLLATYMSVMDRGDWHAYASLFAKDGELMFQKNDWKGPEAIEKGMTTPPKQAPGAPPLAPTSLRLRHMIGSILIKIDGDRATDEAHWIVMSKTADDRPNLGATGHYSDTLVRENGQWKFLRRVIYTDFPFDDPLANQKQ